ncbi:hypothetical protein D6C91_10573, partial [Aureobasidium pullulans]
PNATRSGRRDTRGKIVPISRESTRKKTIPTSKRLLKVLPKKQNVAKSSKGKNYEGPRLYNLSGKGNMLGDKALRFVLLTNTKKGGINALSKIKHY